MKRNIDELLDNIDSALAAGNLDVITVSTSNSQFFCENPFPMWDPQNYRDMFGSVSTVRSDEFRFRDPKIIEIPDSVHPNAHKYIFNTMVDDRPNNLNILFRLFTFRTRQGKYMNVQADVKECNHEAEICFFNVLISDDHAGLLLSVLLYYYHSQGFSSIRWESWKYVETVEDDDDDEDDIGDDIGKIEGLAALEDYFEQLVHPSGKFTYEDTTKSYIHHFQRLDA